MKYEITTLKEGQSCSGCGRCDGSPVLVISRLKICCECFKEIASNMEREIVEVSVYQKEYRKKKISNTVRWQVYERDGFACLLCGSKKDLCCDHITPEKHGGEKTLENLQTLCRSCNSKKKTNTVDHRKK